MSAPPLATPALAPRGLVGGVRLASHHVLVGRLCPHAIGSGSEDRRRQQGRVSGGWRAFSVVTTAAEAAVAPIGPVAEESASSLASSSSLAVSPVTVGVDGGSGSSVESALFAVLEAADGTILEPLGWTNPADLLLRLLSTVHDSLGMEWGATILLSTLIFRTLIFPIACTTARGTSRMLAVRPKMEALKARHDAGEIDGNTMNTQIRDLYASADVHPLKTMAGPLAQMPLFMSFFFGLRKVRVWVCR
jgi:hypothetical protein